MRRLLTLACLFLIFTGVSKADTIFSFTPDSYSAKDSFTTIATWNNTTENWIFVGLGFGDNVDWNLVESDVFADPYFVLAPGDSYTGEFSTVTWKENVTETWYGEGSSVYVPLDGTNCDINPCVWLNPVEVRANFVATIETPEPSTISLMFVGLAMLVKKLKR